MKSELAGVHCLDGVPATIAKHLCHVFNLKRQEMTNLKRKVSYAEIMEKWIIYGLGYMMT
jgi:hypothetical protein